MHAEREASERSAARVAVQLLAHQVGSAECGAGVTGYGLDGDVRKAAAAFERMHQKYIQENATRETERMGVGLLLKICGELEDDLFEVVLRAARQVGAYDSIRRGITGGEPEFAIEPRGEDAAMVGTGGEVAPVEGRQAVGFPGEELAESRKEFRLAIFAEPLDLVLVLVGAESGELGDAGVEPAEGIRKLQSVELADFVAVTRRELPAALLDVGAAVQGKDERAIKAGGVVGASSVAKMMFEMRRARAAAKLVVELLLRHRFDNVRPFFGRTTLGKRNASEVREAQMAFMEAALKRQARDVGTFLAAEFFFFDGEQDGLVVNERDRSAAAKCGDAENVHGLGAECSHFCERLRQTDQVFAVSARCANREPLVVR